MDTREEGLHPAWWTFAHHLHSDLFAGRTGRKIVCVCVLTGVMPPTGFTLFVPEESVTDVSWSLNQALQAIVSGGITAPTTIEYFAAPGQERGPVLGDVQVR